MGSGIYNKINEFLCNPKNVKKRRNMRLEKCYYGHVNIAPAFIKSSSPENSFVVDLRDCAFDGLKSDVVIAIALLFGLDET